MIRLLPLLALGLLAACDTDAPGPAAPPSGEVRATPPVVEAGDFADRVHYDDGNSREWGTVCRLPEGGYVSVDHVTRNGTPVVGPKDAVVLNSEPSDWSLLGVDPAALDPADFPVLAQGDLVTLAGFPARDIEGEIAPAKVYVPDGTPPFLWVELLPLGPGLPPEGAVGGQSGSCVLKDGKVAGVVSANGFSKIAGTTNTWALIVPMADILAEVRGEADYTRRAMSLLADTRPRPDIASGRGALRPVEID